jgi:two-component system, chemotaxis family, chemotaxis protein CheY
MTVAKILAVDDSKVIREMMNIILSQAGHDVVCAEDGIEALKIAEKDTFDLVLSDLNMPNMNGNKLVMSLRRMPAYRTTPIIMITTESSVIKKETAKGIGANGWITKPIKEASLLKTVSGVLA